MNLTPPEAAALTAWIKKCEGYRTLFFVRGADPNTRSGADVDQFIREHPAIRAAWEKLQACAKEAAE